MTKKQTGFSLFELLVTCSIIFSLLIFVIPSHKQLFDKSSNQIASSQLLHAINLARSEAILRGSTVTLCKSKDQQTCGGEWQDGYIIQAEEKPIFVFEKNTKGFLYWRAFPSNRSDLQFLPSGFPNAENGTYWYCTKGSKNPAWAIALSQTGRARLVNPNKSGKIIDRKGNPLKC